MTKAEIIKRLNSLEKRLGGAIYHSSEEERAWHTLKEEVSEVELELMHLRWELEKE